jgi:hypothetical protein
VRETADGGFLVAASSASGMSGTKGVSGFGSRDYWIVKLSNLELPVGTPITLVNGLFSAASEHDIPATNEVWIELQSSLPNHYIYYTLDGSEPDAGSAYYEGPFAVSNSVILRAIAYDEQFVEFVEADPVAINVVPLYDVVVRVPGGGSVTVDPPVGPYLSNSVVRLTALTSNGWVFMSWAGEATGTNPVLELTVDGDREIQAVFGTFLTNTVSPLGFGVVVLEPAQGPYEFGSTVRLSAVPQPGKYFSARRCGCRPCRSLESTSSAGRGRRATRWSARCTSS